MGRIIPHIMENKKCLKPPTSSAVACWKRPTLPEGCWIHRDTLCFFASGNMRPWKLSKEKEQVMSTVGILGFINPWLCSLGPSHFSSRLWMFVEKPTKLIYPEFMNPGLMWRLALQWDRIELHRTAICGWFGYKVAQGDACWFINPDYSNYINSFLHRP